MTPLRCLWVTRLLPFPPFVGGDATYSARMIESLAAAGVDVTVLCHENGGPRPPEQARTEWITVPFRDRKRVQSLFGRSPAIVDRFSTPQIRRAFRSLVEEQVWDAVVIDNFAVVGVLDARLWVRNHNRPAPLVYVSHNHEETIREQLAASSPRQSPRGWALRRDAAKAARLERRLVEVADLVTANTEYDAELYRTRSPKQRYLVLTPGYEGPLVNGRAIEEQTPRRITLLGSYAWIAKQQNLWRFLETAMHPFARAGIGIDIVGWAPDAFAKRLRRSFPDAVVTGRVDSVAPYLAQSRMGIVAEEIGGGFKHKVLDYVFNRVPVASLAGSVAGTPLVAGESILEFPSLTRLVEGVIGTIDDLARLNAVQKAAFRACNGRFAWPDRGRALAAALARLRSEAPSGT